MRLGPPRSAGDRPRCAAWQTLRYAQDPVRYYADLLGRFGDTCLTPTLNGPVLVSIDRALIQALFAVDPRALGVFGGASLRPIFGEHALTMQQGEPHQQARRLIQPLLTGAALRALVPAMHEAAAAALSGWPRGRPLQLHPALLALSIDGMVRSVFGASPPALRRRLQDTALSLVAATRPSLLFFPVLRRDYLGLSPWRRFRRLREQLHALSAEALAGAGAGPDLIAALRDARGPDGQGLPPAALIQQALMLIYAGYETTAAALAWALCRVAATPGVQARLRAELRGVPASGWLRLQYLEAVCLETLRLHPVIPDIDRELLSPQELAGRAVPAGVAVAVPMCALHQDPRLYPDPARFDPARFLESRRGPCEYLPFGGGARRCIGAAYALQQMKLVLGAVLSRVEVELLAPPPAAVRRGLLMVPAGGVPVRLRDVERSPHEPTAGD